MDTAQLPADVASGLDAFVEATVAALGDDLVSVVLFGSAAEGRMRATSDVNVIIVMKRFTAERIDRLREPLRLAHATIRLETMLILDSEIAEAAEAFAVKFADIAGRHRVLAGVDVLAGLTPSRGAMRTRVNQILLNFVLRTRERYALVSLREEQLAPLVADCAAPLRAAAEIILQLEGRPAASPKEALEKLAAEVDANAWREPLAELSKAREDGALSPGVGARTVLKLIDLGQALRRKAAALSA
jgi:predicted nucleotidyltransferase